MAYYNDITMEANNKSQNFYEKSIEPGSPYIFKSTMSNRNSNIRIIRSMGVDSELSKEKFMKNEEIDAHNDRAQKDDFFLESSNPNFSNIKSKNNNYIIYFYS